MSYGARIADAMRQGGICVGRILILERCERIVFNLKNRRLSAPGLREQCPI
jgi:hypothetical protein